MACVGGLGGLPVPLPVGRILSCHSTVLCQVTATTPVVWVWTRKGTESQAWAWVAYEGLCSPSEHPLPQGV